MIIPFLKFGFTAHDYKERMNLGEVLAIAEKLGQNLRYAEFETGGTYYDYAIYNDIVDELSEKERETLPQFFLDVMMQSDSLEEFELKRNDSFCTINIKEYRRYVDKVNPKVKDDWA